MVINTNVEASSTANNLNVSQSQLAKSLSRLSSGSKIIQPSDDAAGLAVASRLQAQIKRLDSALSNVINAVSFTQTQDGFMKTIDAALRRMGELAMLAQDTTKSGDDIKLYNEEFTQLKAYISATKSQQFNDVDLFGSATLAVTVDAGGSTFGMPPVDLSVAAYSDALADAKRSYRLDDGGYITSKAGYVHTKPVWSVTQAGAILKTDAWKTSQAGYVIKEDHWKIHETTYGLDNPGDVWKLKQDLWYNGSTNQWSATDNGGTKYLSESYIKKGNVSGHPNITVDPITQLGSGVAVNLAWDGDPPINTVGDPYQTVNFLTVGNGNLESADVETLLPGDWMDINPTLYPHGPNATKYPAGSFITNLGTPPDGDIGTGEYVSVGVGSLVAVNPVTSGEDTAASAYVSGSFTTGNTAGLLNGAAQYLTVTSAMTSNTVVHVDPTASGNNEDPTASESIIGHFVAIPTVNSANFVFDVDDILTTVNAGDYVLEADSDEDPAATAVSAGTTVNTAQDLFWATDLGHASGTSLEQIDGARFSLNLVKSAINQVATDRAQLGAVQSRLNFSKEQLVVTKENLSSAISRITDVDVAEEATQYARYQILVQSGTQMLRQANQLPASALQLLTG